MKNWKKYIKFCLVFIAVLTAISLLLSLKLSFSSSLRIVFGSVYVLFIPGFVWSYVFLEKSLDLVERILLSFAISIACGPLAIFFLNKLGIKISLWSSFFIILAIVILGLIFVFFQRKKYSN